MKVIEASLKTCLFTMNIESQTAPEFIDVTDRVIEIIRQSEVQHGFVVVFSKHTTAAITIQENEPLLLEDMKSLLERISPRNAHYRHNDFSVRTVHMHENECPNGHSHCQHLTLGTSETIPIFQGKLTLGQWQRIFMVELDGEAPSPYREVLVQILGV
jgi:secondary thiamine-phosphate synthase enzyme|tara:strand:- start:163 stop:636 length:474 start_codon:yes stop_codon:yes gene_type:complete